jgi:hypothetical protein
MPVFTRRSIIAAVAALFFLAACKGDQPVTPAAPARPPDLYTVRGEIVRLPAPGAERRELAVRHEPIPEFKDEAGAVVGMNAMVMPFRVAPEVPLDGLEKGDKIRFRVAMDWARNTLRIESLEELPPETTLDYGVR